MLFSILLSGVLALTFPHGSEESASDSLHPVTITSDRGLIVSRIDSVSLSNATDVSEALLRCHGLQISDNGGISGLKTVSLRGMGGAHTAVYVDGVRVGNVQSGQPDLGMFDVASIGSVAVDYAQNSISFNTARPSFGSSAFAGRARMYAGSFGTYLPSVRLDFRLSDAYSLSANVSGVFSKGDFRCPDGSRRINNDISQGRAGLDLWGILEGGDLHIKMYYNHTDRGTPGSFLWPSSDRQNDRNAFVQGVLRKRFSKIYSLNVSLKGAYDDLSYFSSYGDSRYRQIETQLNTSHSFRISDAWNISVAADFWWDGLNATMYSASRTSVLTAVGASYRSERVSVNTALEYSGAFDKGALSRNAFSPSIDMRAEIVKGLDVVAFVRRAYRVPTFNELYYAGFGNPSLRPEDAWLTDIGLDYASEPLLSDLRIRARLNAFYNRLTDKIISAPTAEDPNIWLPYNIGKVRTAGADAMCGLVYTKDRWTVTSDVKYSYMSSMNLHTGTPVPFTARHVLSINADVDYAGWSLDALWQMRSGRSDGYVDLPAWNTLDAALSKNFSLGKFHVLGFKVMVKNILDCRYETVSGYPMPGRSFMGGVEYKF